MRVAERLGDGGAKAARGTSDEGEREIGILCHKREIPPVAGQIKDNRLTFAAVRRKSRD
jgi:hypothetical protein